MGISKLPLKDTPEAQEIIDRYLIGEQDTLFRELGYRNRNALQSAMRRTYGISFKETQQSKSSLDKEVIYTPYPEFKIVPFTIGKRRRDKESIGIVLADWHIGKKTESYSIVAFKKRHERILNKVARIIELHAPIDKAYILRLGDNVQGENIYQGSKVGDTECGAWEQINDYAVPAISQFDMSLLQLVGSIDDYGVWGNHGIYGREATTKTNWDNFVYKGAEVALSNQQKITIHCPSTFYQLVNIYGFLFFLFHGNQVRANAGIPLFALRRKLQEWYAYVGGFHYAYGGHFHTWGADQINSVANYELCPPLVTGDEWALEVVGRASSPIQLCFGIHPKQGRTWEYKLYSDNDYLPKPSEVIT